MSDPVCPDCGSASDVFLLDTGDGPELFACDECAVVFDRDLANVRA